MEGAGVILGGAESPGNCVVASGRFFVYVEFLLIPKTIIFSKFIANTYFFIYILKKKTLY
jgi:hypothetical protein